MVTLGCAFLHLEGQSFGLKQKATLVQKLSETSGLIVVGGKFYTHGDSGDEPILYEFDTLTGKINRTVFVQGATNKDWEEMTQDDSFVYIGDFGNNAGMRKDLVIYKIQKALLSLDTIRGVDTIQFGYEQQVDFSNKTFQTNFDAEAMIATDSCLYIFSKNWGNFKTYIYECSKKKGQYLLKINDSIEANGLITGACFSPFSGKLLLCGYTLNVGFVLECDSFLSRKIKKQLNRMEFPAFGNIQIEAIAEVAKDRYFLTSEQLNSDAALFELSKVKTSGLRNNRKTDIQFFLNLNQDAKMLTWQSASGIREMQIFKMDGQLVQIEMLNHRVSGEIDISFLQGGIYVVKSEFTSGERISMKIYFGD